METIDDKARRMLRLNFLTAMKRDKPFGSVATDEHYAVAEQIGNEGIVLLKNAPVGKKGPKLLPLNPDVKSILVVGDNATRDLMKAEAQANSKSKTTLLRLTASVLSTAIKSDMHRAIAQAARCMLMSKTFPCRAGLSACPGCSYGQRCRCGHIYRRTQQEPPAGLRSRRPP